MLPAPRAAVSRVFEPRLCEIGRRGDQLIPEAKLEPRLGEPRLGEIGRPSDQLIPGAIRAVHPLLSVAKKFS